MQVGICTHSLMNIQPNSSYHDRLIRNTRHRSLLFIAVAMAMGLVARAYRNEPYSNLLLTIVAAYSADTLWGFMCYFVARLFLPQAAIITLAIVTLLVTCGIEFSQLWTPSWLVGLRSVPTIGFMLGRSFVWSDIACLFVGVGAGSLMDRFAGSKLLAHQKSN